MLATDRCRFGPGQTDKCSRGDFFFMWPFSCRSSLYTQKHPGPPLAQKNGLAQCDTEIQAQTLLHKITMSSSIPKKQKKTIPCGKRKEGNALKENNAMHYIKTMP